MVKQKLFIGDNYYDGFNGKRLMVVGHQKHATIPEIQNYKHKPESYNYDEDNRDMMGALINGKWREWEPHDRKSLLQFGKMLTSNYTFQLGTEESNKLWNSLAFCNYLQIPDFNSETRQGKDKEYFYLFAESVFKEYLNEAKPDKIIVWGKIVWPYIVKMGTPIDDGRCIIHLESSKPIDVLSIYHPSRLGIGGYPVIMKRIKDFLQEQL